MASQSKKPRTTPSRNIVRHGDIVASLRQRILEGELASGHRLPTHAKLEKQFGTTPITVQKALSVLRQQGFIRSQLRRGTFVAENLPHRYHYALALSFRQEENLTQFYAALRNEAGRFASAGRHFSIFYEIGGHTDTEDYQRLVGFVRAHRLAGLIFAEQPYQVLGSPLLEEPGIPRVVIGSDAGSLGLPSVYPDLDTFLPKALDDLAARGRRRIALIKKADKTRRLGEHDRAFLEGVTARGMVTRSYWVQSVHTDTPQCGYELAQLLLQGPPAERPDGLIIRDDNLVEHVTAGLAATDVRVPGDLNVVAHTNFPWPTPSAVPVRRLGYDIRELLELCVQRIEALRRNEPAPLLTLLPTMFEEELAAKKTTVGLVASH